MIVSEKTASGINTLLRSSAEPRDEIGMHTFLWKFVLHSNMQADKPCMGILEGLLRAG